MCLDLFNDFGYEGGHLVGIDEISGIQGEYGIVTFPPDGLTSSNFSGFGVRTAVTLISDMTDVSSVSSGLGMYGLDRETIVISKRKLMVDIRMKV